VALHDGVVKQYNGGGEEVVSAWLKPTAALRAAQKLIALKGHDFSRAEKCCITRGFRWDETAGLAGS
jgi:hypothetical protein